MNRSSILFSLSKSQPSKTAKGGAARPGSNFSSVKFNAMAHREPLKYVFYFAASPEKVWDGFVSAESNRVIFTGAELKTDLKPGSSIEWVGPGPDGKPMAYVHGEVLQVDAPRLLQYTFAMGPNQKMSRATIELVPESEATQVTVVHDEWADDDPTYAACADGWPRILSRLKTLIETGKTFKPH